MKRCLSLWCSLFIACVMLAACGVSEAEHAQWLAERKAEQAGHRFEYLADRKLLWVRGPNGKEESIDLSEPTRLYLYRLLGKDAEDGRDAYLWMVSANGREAHVPYFATEPQRFLSTIAPVMPGIDPARAQARFDAFERGEFEFCTIWMSPGSQEIQAASGYRVCPPIDD